MLRNQIVEFAIITAFCGAVAGSACAQVEGKFLLFDAPGAGTETGQGTFPTGINEQGTVIGYYIDGSNLQHGLSEGQMARSQLSTSQVLF